jgi:16S rRNA (cytidine1402-2'-O)-methyltransferase
MSNEFAGKFIQDRDKNNQYIASSFKPGVYFTATPIGHLDDITVRALKLFHHSTRILCEDTRLTQRLLSHYGMKKKLYRFDEHRQHHMLEQIGHWVKNDQEIIVVVSDAGTPLVSDPGMALVHYCQSHDIYYTALPGPCSWVNALVLCGIQPINTVFGGFIDHVHIADLQDSPHDWVMFVSAHKIEHYLQKIHALIPGRPLWIAREMTKVFEQILHGTAGVLLDHFRTKLPKGEMVLIVRGKVPGEVSTLPTSSPLLWQDALKKLLDHHSLKDSVDMICHQFAFSQSKSRKIVYDEALKIKGQLERC